MNMFNNTTLEVGVGLCSQGIIKFKLSNSQISYRGCSQVLMNTINGGEH